MLWEGVAPEEVPAQVEMVEARRGRGTYTDDTEMMILLGESLAEHGVVDEADLVQRFLDACDLARGYGGGTREVMSLWRAGVPVETAASQVFGGAGSAGNGAAMRIAALAVRFAGSARLGEQAARSAAVTHRHPLGVDGAVVQAAAVAAALRGEDALAAAESAAATPEMAERLRRVRAAHAHALEPGEVAARLGNGSKAHESVPAALYAATAHDDFEGAVTFAVRCGGDTDTIAAMAGAIAGARGGASSIPARWLDALEDGRRGRRHVEALAERLAARDDSARPEPS